jgi:hypothetical protein
MNNSRKAIALLAIQLLLVLSIAGKYLYERKTRPRIWVRAAQFDPNQPLRGRYLALQLLVDACSLPHDTAHLIAGLPQYPPQSLPGSWHWEVALDAENGKLLPRLADAKTAGSDRTQIYLPQGQPCDRAPVQSAEEYFIPDTAKQVFPLPSGQQLWVEVTVPPAGPPRPIQLAISSEDGFHTLKFE